MCIDAQFLANDALEVLPAISSTISAEAVGRLKDFLEKELTAGHLENATPKPGFIDVHRVSSFFNKLTNSISLIKTFMSFLQISASNIHTASVLRLGSCKRPCYSPAACKGKQIWMDSDGFGCLLGVIDVRSLLLRSADHGDLTSASEVFFFFLLDVSRTSDPQELSRQLRRQWGPQSGEA